MKKYFIGVDNGGTMTKSAVFDAGGNQLAYARENTPQACPHPGWCDRDMDALWMATARCIREAVKKAGISPADIAGVGCTGHGKGLYLWGRDNRPAAPGVASTDHRAGTIAARWQADGTAEKARKRTMQPVLDCQPAALLRWFRDNRPAAYRNIRWVFEAKDYIRFRLTGEAYAEYTDYSGTSLLNLNTRQFDRELLRLFGIEEVWEALPPLRESADICGRITSEAAAITGIPEGTPVCGGMFDIDACAIAMDVSTENRLCAITGTWSINEYISRTPVPSDGTTLNSLFCLPDYYLIEESSPTSAGNLDWAIGHFMGAQKQPATQRGESLYQMADRLVGELDPADSRAVFVPFLYGSNESGVDHAAVAGLDHTYGTADLLRAVFEGVVYSHRTHIERLQKHNPRLDRLRMAGGAIRSAVWVQMFADGLGMPVEVVSAEELGAKGAAMAAAVAAGFYRDFGEAAEAMVRISATVIPDPIRTAVYNEKYAYYRRLVKALGEIRTCWNN